MTQLYECLAEDYTKIKSPSFREFPCGTKSEKIKFGYICWLLEKVPNEKLEGVLTFSSSDALRANDLPREKQT